jgi:hypothetical protein
MDLKYLFNDNVFSSIVNANQLNYLYWMNFFFFWVLIVLQYSLDVEIKV